MGKLGNNEIELATGGCPFGSSTNSPGGWFCRGGGLGRGRGEVEAWRCCSLPIPTPPKESFPPYLVAGGPEVARRIVDGTAKAWADGEQARHQGRDQILASTGGDDGVVGAYREGGTRWGLKSGDRDRRKEGGRGEGTKIKTIMLGCGSVSKFVYHPPGTQHMPLFCTVWVAPPT